jgi:lactoylglutathione lyase
MSLDELPLMGIANPTFKVADLVKARGFYHNIMGFDEAFDIKDSAGKVTSAYFKVNDDQYIEVAITPELKPGDRDREARIVFQSTNLEKLHALYESRGLNPGKIETGPDGNPVFRVVSPEGRKFDFLQYAATSEQGKSRGKFLSPDRTSIHIWHVGVMTKDSTASGPFYAKLGLASLRTDRRGEYVETPSGDQNTETKPPLKDTPETHDRYESEQWGAANHIGLEVTDMRYVRDALQKRGGYDDLRVRAHVGGSRHWLMFVFDPSGTRMEMMESATQEVLPSNTVMKPGSYDTIPPTPQRGFGWP